MQRDDFIVDWAMCYGSPSMAQKLSIRDKGCDRNLLAALYPQYSATTTATAYDRRSAPENALAARHSHSAPAP